MIPKELFQNVRRIEITTKRLATDVFAGQYHSVFKGHGMEFDEVREYQMGDDIRSIDWNVTARTGRPHIKKFVEERELTVMILVDASASCRFATAKQLKSQLAAEIAAALAFSAINNNDKVGLIIFTDQIEKFIPPRKGLRHVLRVIREVLYFEAKGRSTDIIHALDYFNKVTTRKSVGFIVSDFFEIPPTFPPPQRGEGSILNFLPRMGKVRFSNSLPPVGRGREGGNDLKKALKMTNRRHDMIAVTLNDPVEMDLSNCGLLELEDAETGQRILLDSSDQNLRERYRQQAADRLRDRETLFNSVGMDHVDLSTNSSYVQELVKFFFKRRRKLARK